jgi:hypothetical protein
MSITWSARIFANGHSRPTERAQDKMHFLKVSADCATSGDPMKASWVLAALVLQLW